MLPLVPTVLGERLMRILAIGILALVLAGCNRSSVATDGSDQGDAPARLSAKDVTEASAAATDASAAGPTVGVPAGAPMLAYSYSYGLQAKPSGVRTLLARHAAACAAAGPAVCQVTSSRISSSGPDRVNATLVVRATPAWLGPFRSGLEAQVRSAGGQIVDAQVESEDLSRQIVDAEATLLAKTTLRDRLQGLLASRPGKVSDLVEIERSLAQVQGEIDSARSTLEMMRKRVSMSDLTLEYASGGVMAPRGVWSPLSGAVGDFIGIIAATLAAFIRFIAWTAPWAIIGGLLFWLVRKRLPRFGRRVKPGPA